MDHEIMLHFMFVCACLRGVTYNSNAKATLHCCLPVECRGLRSGDFDIASSELPLMRRGDDFFQLSLQECSYGRTA